MDLASSAPEEGWRSAVSVREDIELAAVLTGRLPPASAPRAVSVTDLLAPRRAFWRAISSVRIPAARQQRVDLGRSIHRRLGAVLSADGALEVRIRREGVVGRIDLLSDVPVEVKTSSSSVEPTRLADARPDQVEQLAMYCALAGRSVGRLLTIVVNGPPGIHTQAVDLRFGPPEALWREIRDRLDRLRRAWADRRATDLPACRWFGRGCEFQDAAVCDCAGTEPFPPLSALSDVRETSERAELSLRIDALLRELPESAPAPTVHRFRDLLYPRRAYFERTTPEPAVELPPRAPGEPPDLYARLSEAVESGPLGEVARLPPRSDEPEEEVGGFRGVPYLLRTSRARGPASVPALLDRQPQYALELGFRCAATGNATGRLILGREDAPSGRDLVQVFEFRFAPVSVFARRWRERARQLAASLVARAPQELPPCPEWMYLDCPYRPACACGSSGTRSQR